MDDNAPRPMRRPPSLSYKFQRLRERLRAAIESGEFAGKLPGERELARRFDANAKTMSKALTDLASEGLLERSIGRGTYVRGSAPQQIGAEKWLIVCPQQMMSHPLVRTLQERHPDHQLISDITSLRPSFLNQFKAFLLVGMRAPEVFVRDLLLRSAQVVSIGCEQPQIATHVVATDRAWAGLRLGRDLMLGGHRRILAVEPRGRRAIYDALRQAADRYAPDADIDACFPDEAAQAVANGATALVVDDPSEADAMIARLREQGLSIPGHVSIVAMGCLWNGAPCSGQYVTPQEKAQAVLDLLAQRPTRPATIWLTGRHIDAGTISSHHTPTESLPPLPDPRLVLTL